MWKDMMADFPTFKVIKVPLVTRTDYKRALKMIIFNR